MIHTKCLLKTEKSIMLQEARERVLFPRFDNLGGIKTKQVILTGLGLPIGPLGPGLGATMPGDAVNYH